MSELKVIAANNKEYKVEVENDTSGLLNGNKFEWDVEHIKGNAYHIIKDNKSYNLEVLNVNKEQKLFFVKVDGEQFKFTVKDQFDDLLHSLGMDNLAAAKVSDLKAPMPGLVLEISVEIGQEVVKGETLLILEAMKMENVIKSPTDGVIKSVSVNKADTVEKNQVILNFE